MSNRRGFSLIELLVVVSILAILAVLSISVMNGVLNQAREDATAMTVTKVSELVEERSTAFDRAANGAVLSQAADQVELVVKQRLGLPFQGVEPRLLRRRVAEIIARKVLFAKNFPQRFTELDDANGNLIPDLIESRTDITFDSASHDPVTESSELLYFMLTKMPVFGVSPVAIDGFTSEEVKDTDNDGLLEFVDAWGNPLRFYRWPTRLIEVDNFDTDSALAGVQGEIVPAEREFAGLLIKGLPDQNGITRDPLLVDPNDSIGRLGFELQRLSPANDAPDLSLYYNEATFHTPDVYHTPLIVSAGADGEIGLGEPYQIDTTNGIYGNLASPPDTDGNGTIDLIDLNAVLDLITDNISNRNRRAGGSN